MRIFLYEFVTGGGWYDVDPHQPPSGSLLAEGAAMLRAVASDFLALPGIEVFTLRNARLKSVKLPTGAITRMVASQQEADRAYEELVLGTEFTLVIAPEFNGHLLRRTRTVERLGKGLLSPNAEFVAIASDKCRTYQYFRANNVPTPDTWLLEHDDPHFPTRPIRWWSSRSMAADRWVCSYCGRAAMRSIGRRFQAERSCRGSVPALQRAWRCCVDPGIKIRCRRFDKRCLRMVSLISAGEGPLPDHLLLRAAMMFALPDSAAATWGSTSCWAKRKTPRKIT